MLTYIYVNIYIYINLYQPLNNLLSASQSAMQISSDLWAQFPAVTPLYLKKYTAK